MPSSRTFQSQNPTISFCTCVLVSIVIPIVILIVYVEIRIYKNVLNNEVEYFATIPKTYLYSESMAYEDRDVYQNVFTSFLPREDFVMIQKNVKFKDNENNVSNESLSRRTNSLVKLKSRRAVETLNDDYTYYGMDFTTESDQNQPQEEYENYYEKYIEKQSTTTTEKEVNDYEIDTESGEFSTNIENLEGNNFNFWRSSESKEFIRATQAKIMEQYMDLSADPCEDFYQFACGNWRRYNKIPADKSMYNTFEILRSNLDIILRDLLTQQRKDEKYETVGSKLSLDEPVLKIFQEDKCAEAAEENLDIGSNLKSKTVHTITITETKIVQEHRKHNQNHTGNDKYNKKPGNMEHYEKKRNGLQSNKGNNKQEDNKRDSIGSYKDTKKDVSENDNGCIKKGYYKTKNKKQNVKNYENKRNKINRMENIVSELNRKKDEIEYSIDKKIDEIENNGANTQNEKTENATEDKEKNSKENKKGHIKESEKEDEINRIRRQSSGHLMVKKSHHVKESIITNSKAETEDALVKARNYYKSCLNENLLSKRGSQPLLDLLDMFGGWPLLNKDWNDADFDWIETTAKLKLFNNDILISEWVGLDMKNSSNYIVQFDQTSLGLPTREYFLRDSYKLFLEAYENYLIDIALLLGGEEKQVKLDTEEMIDFEIELAKITTPADQRGNITELYHKFTIQELENKIRYIDWHRYLSVVLDRVVEPDEYVVVLALDYVTKLADLVKETKPRVLANYLLWRFVKHRVSNLDDRYRAAKQKFYLVLYGRQESPPRWRTCVSVVNSNMGMALGAMFVQQYFDESSKKDNIAIIKDIQAAFRELILETEWMENKTKELALNKLNSIILRIGYPDYILNKKDLDDKYKGLKIDPNKYFENTLNILFHTTKRDQMRLTEAVNKSVWNTFPAIVNAYYSRNKNQIIFPAGILQPPFYHKYFPRSLNYGGIGVVIGHEVTHGFDDKGRLFNSEGNMQRWWTDEDVEAFHERSQCIIQQYENFYVPEVDMHVNGAITQGENIADNGGVKQAFRAYLQWTQRNGIEDETLPGLNYTNTQLFFINFAQIWCGDMRENTMKNKLKSSVHPPGKFRVIGTLTNSKDFANEFDCYVGSAMNPETKCTVW